MLRAELVTDPDVLFAAYKVEHPLFANFVMRIQTVENYPPREALRKACMRLYERIEQLRKNISNEWQLAEDILKDDENDQHL